MKEKVLEVLGNFDLQTFNQRELLDLIGNVVEEYSKEKSAAVSIGTINITINLNLNENEQE